MENNIYDLAILGAGPAGICAAIYATRAKLNTIWLDVAVRSLVSMK